MYAQCTDTTRVVHREQVADGVWLVTGPGGPTDANAVELTSLMTGVEIFEPDWADIDKNLTGYVDAWKSATGS